MQSQTTPGTSSRRSGDIGPGRRPLLTIWIVVNLVNVLQAMGFVSRIQGPVGQRIAGLTIALLAIPAAIALNDFRRDRAGWRFLLGPALFIAFVVLMLVVEYVLEIEFRSPARPAILVPFVTLFFASIFFMGGPMVRIDRRRWATTAATATLLIVAMVFAMLRGVG